MHIDMRFEKFFIFALVPLILSIGITPAFSLQPEDVDTECREGQVLVYRTNYLDYICTSQSAASIWEKYGLAEIIKQTQTAQETIVSMPEPEVSEETSRITLPQHPEQPEVHPNIVFILTDNQAIDGLSVYGNKDVNTPNLDRLASEGILFNNVFAANGICSPTRASLMTGLLSSQHGVHNAYYDQILEELPEGWNIVQEFRTLPQTLSHRGYDTAMIGKWHLGQPWEPSLGFKHWVAFPHGITVNFWDNIMVVNGEVVEVKDKHIVEFLTEKGVEYIESQDGNTPFYLQLNYDSPYTLPPVNWGPAKNQFYSDYENMEFQSMPIVPSK